MAGRPLAFPKGLVLRGGPWAFAQNDIWFTDSMERTYRFNGKAWAMDPGLTSVTRMQKLGPGVYLAAEYTEGKLFQKNCWRQVPYIQEEAFMVGKEGAYLSGNTLQLFNPLFVTEY